MPLLYILVHYLVDMLSHHSTSATIRDATSTSMVHFKPPAGPWYDMINDLNMENWKLDNHERATIKDLQIRLRGANFSFSNSANKSRLLQLLSRSERGLLAFDACSNEELQLFCRDRHINIEGKKTRNNLIRHLEQADEAAAFDRFLDLPAELRNRVYIYHLDTFEQTTHRPRPPPITELCRQIRQETLLLYYHSLRLALKFTQVNHHLARPYLISTRPIHVDDRTDRIRKSLPERRLCQVQKLRISLCLIGQGLKVETSWDVDFLAGSPRAVICASTRWIRSHNVPSGVLDLKDQFQSPMQQMMDSIATRGDDVKLRRSNVEALQAMFAADS